MCEFIFEFGQVVREMILYAKFATSFVSHIQYNILLATTNSTALHQVESIYKVIYYVYP